jgi:hypothetical protein
LHLVYDILRRAIHRAQRAGLPPVDAVKSLNLRNPAQRHNVLSARGVLQTLEHAIRVVALESHGAACLVKVQERYMRSEFTEPPDRAVGYGQADVRTHLPPELAGLLDQVVRQVPKHGLTALRHQTQQSAPAVRSKILLEGDRVPEPHDLLAPQPIHADKQSVGELPRPKNERLGQMEDLIGEMADAKAKRLGMGRREFMERSMALATAFLAANWTRGGRGHFRFQDADCTLFSAFCEVSDSTGDC